MRARLAVLAASLCCSCAERPPERAAPKGLDGYAEAVGWTAVGDEAAQLLSAFVRVDTVNPPGHELAGAQFLAQALARDGIEARIIELGDGRANLIATLAATAPATPKEKPLCLLSHLDVVSSEAEKWAHAPLSGELVDGTVWGRGAIDMKGMAVIELLALAQLERQAVPLKRDVVLLAVADEEIGHRGMSALLEDGWPDCGQLLNEGGIGLKNGLSEGQTVFAISVAEKGVLWLKLRARGEAGHGSVPAPGRAPMELLRGATALMAREPTPRIHPALYELLRRSGEQRGGLSGVVLQRPALVDLLAQGKLLAKPTTRAAITDTCQVTGFSGIGSSINVIPSEVYANVDCRLLPGTKPDDLLAELKTRLKDFPSLELEVASKEEANESPWDDDFFAALARNVVRGRTDAVAGPMLSTGYTDSLLARPKGTHAYGLIPFEISQEELGTMHGKDERVTVENLRRGTEVLFRSVVDVAAAAAR